jgi:hypothetical protein
MKRGERRNAGKRRRERNFVPSREACLKPDPSFPQIRLKAEAMFPSLR